jgi:hypothetical protein
LSKRRIFKAGIVAARRQLIAVLIVTVAVLLLPSHNLTGRDMPSTESDAEAFRIAVSQLLKWAYLLIAVGLTLTTDRPVDLTAERIRRAFSVIRRIAPEHTLKALAFQLSLATVMLAAFTLSSPPELLAALGRNLGCACIASIGWAGMMSVGVAFFGASTHAVLKAL